MDGLLKSLPNKKGEAPRLVHRLDRDTSGCLVVAKTQAAASHFGDVFRSRSARKIYWAVVAGNPHPKQGEISCFLAKQATPDGEQMVVVKNGMPGAQHSMSYYSTTDTASRRFAWVTLKPVTGPTHQLRVHMAQLGTPDHRRSALFQHRELDGAPGLARACICMRAASAAVAERQEPRCFGAAAAAYAAELRCARLRSRPLRRAARRIRRTLMSLIVFDMDGTLIDTQALISEHMATTFAGAGLVPPVLAGPPGHRPVAAGRDGPAGAYRRCRADRGWSRATRPLSHFAGHDAGRDGLFPGAMDALTGCASARHADGHCDGQGIAGVHRILGLHGIADHFVTLQTPDHNPSKPHPGMLLRAMDETGTQPQETVMIGDTTFDIEMGKAAGAKAIGVTWGYHEPDELLDAGADVHDRPL